VKLEDGQWRLRSSRLSIKGGLLGVRIVEKRNNRQRVICVHKDELPWLVGAVEKAANVDTSEVLLGSTQEQGTYV
jgi:hypothetical protein